MQFFHNKVVLSAMMLFASICSAMFSSATVAAHPYLGYGPYLSYGVVPRTYIGHHYRWRHPRPVVYSAYYPASYSAYHWGSLRPWGGSPWGASLVAFDDCDVYPTVYSSVYRTAYRSVYRPVIRPVRRLVWGRAAYPSVQYAWGASAIDYCPPIECALPTYLSHDTYTPVTSHDTFTPVALSENPAYISRDTSGEEANPVEGLPASLLSAADAIFNAGGYRQAATAYAQLHVRYGSNDTIFARRFVAQVACGDLDQAAVVLASAQGAGFDVRTWQVQHSNWNQLFADDASRVDQLSERLAEHALSQGDQREGLEMMATWLNLTGQSSRAELFLAMTDKLTAAQEGLSVAAPVTAEVISAAADPNIEELPTPRSKSSLVSLE